MHSFVRVAETGSFSAVARELGTGQPNVSRHIGALERHLGIRLLHRSTRKLTLTPEGERYDAEARRGGRSMRSRRRSRTPAVTTRHKGYYEWLARRCSADPTYCRK